MYKKSLFKTNIKKMIGGLGLDPKIDKLSPANKQIFINGLKDVLRNFDDMK